MCGLFGWYLKRADRRVVPLAAVLSVLMVERGTDSWGIYGYPTKDGKCSFATPVLRKDTGEFYESVPARAMKGYPMLMAHTRAASVGDPTKENAHPFQTGTVVGMHNGAIYNWRELNKEWKTNFKVDSQHIFSHIYHSRPFQQLHGWGAITYVDERHPERLCFGKWNGGQMSIAQVKEKRSGEDLGIVWASTYVALSKALSAAGFDWTSLEMKEDQVYIAEPREEDGVPDFFSFGRAKYAFGTRSAPIASTNDDKSWCSTCLVSDLTRYHPTITGIHIKPTGGNNDLTPKAITAGSGKSTELKTAASTNTDPSSLRERIRGIGVTTVSRKKGSYEIWDVIKLPDGTEKLVTVDDKDTPRDHAKDCPCVKCMHGKTIASVQQPLDQNRPHFDDSGENCKMCKCPLDKDETDTTFMGLLLCTTCYYEMLEIRDGTADYKDVTPQDRDRMIARITEDSGYNESGLRYDN